MYQAQKALENCQQAVVDGARRLSSPDAMRGSGPSSI